MHGILTLHRRPTLLLGACTLGLSSPALAQTTPQTSPIRTPAYELYAPDVEAARGAQLGLDFAAREFRRYMGEAPPKIAVVLLDGRGEPMSPAGALPVLHWFTPDGLAQARAHGGATAPRDTARDRAFAESALPHEACHWYLSAYLAGRPTAGPRAAATRQPGAHVGAVGLPAWYNEGFGTLCEPPAWQQARRAQMVRDLDAAIPFAEFMVMPHPKTVSSLPPTAAPHTAEERRAAVAQGDDGRARLFYAQAHTLMRFLAEREGPTFVGIVGRGLAEGDSLPQLLGSATQLPADIGALERAWRSWLVQMPADRRER